VRVGYIDTDASTLIHFTAVFRWVEAAEMELYRKLGLLDGAVRLPRRQVEAEYLLPIRFDDELEVTLRVERVGTSSVTYTWDAVLGGEVAARGRFTAVHTGPTGRAEPLPERAKALLESSTE
jgi:YbgC/YbaW family acyl-CoA thioester hydrolase